MITTRRERWGSSPAALQALEDFAAGDAGIHQNAGAGAGDDGAVAAAAAGQNGDTNSHVAQNTRLACGIGVTGALVTHERIQGRNGELAVSLSPNHRGSNSLNRVGRRQTESNLSLRIS